MDSLLYEGELKFDFPTCIAWEKFDRKDIPRPHGMALVDYIVEEINRLLFIEVKDFSSSTATPERKNEDIIRLNGKELIHQVLVPKARDSWTFLHLMSRTKKPIDYIVLVCIERLQIDRSLLLPFTDNLRARLLHEASEPWKNPYIRHCHVVTLETWPVVLNTYTVIRNN